MICISPLSIPRPNGRGSKDRITVPCGKCKSCWTNKRKEWSLRIYLEMEKAKNAKFVTLTYSDENLTLVNNRMVLNKQDVKAFIKRLREDIRIKYGRYDLRYFIAGEYSPDVLRPHYHCALFNVPEDVLDKIDKIWTNGFVHIGKIEMASINYITGYILDSQKSEEDDYKPFRLMSNGLGKSYLIKNKDYHEKNAEFNYTFIGGIRQKLPRYFKDKIFTKQEIEQESENLRNLISIKNQIWENQQIKKGNSPEYIRGERKKKLLESKNLFKQKKL